MFFLIIIASYLAYIYKFNDKYYVHSYQLLLFFNVVLSMLVFNLFPLYRSWRGVSLLTEIKVIFSACFAVLVIVIIIAFFLKVSSKFSREYAIACFTTEIIAFEYISYTFQAACS